LNTKLILGAVLIVIALIVGGAELFGAYPIPKSDANRWYLYGAVAIIGLVGIILSVWSILKKRTPKQTT
jgi:membrane protein DedA with SNARE-associated domain